MPWATFLSQTSDHIDRSPTYLHLNRPSLALPDEKKVIGPKPGCIFAPTTTAAAIGAVGAVGAGEDFPVLVSKEVGFLQKKFFLSFLAKTFLQIQNRFFSQIFLGDGETR